MNKIKYTALQINMHPLHSCFKLTLYEHHIIRDQTHSKVFVSKILINMENSYVPPFKRNSFTGQECTKIQSLSSRLNIFIIMI